MFWLLKLMIQAFVEYLPVILISMILIYLLIFTAKKIMDETDEDYFEDTIYKYTLIFTTIFTFVSIYLYLQIEISNEQGIFPIRGCTNWDIVKTITVLFIFFSSILMFLLNSIIKNKRIKERTKEKIKENVKFYVFGVLICTCLFFIMKDEIGKVDVFNKYLLNFKPISQENYISDSIMFCGE